MVAVVVVILDHLLGWPSGGFVGVDVFFVISGFLITGLLLREHERTGTISFSGFYRRRIKRILPAALAVLAVTLVAAFLVFNRGRAVTTVIDGFWSLLFAANWRFATVGTDYFGSDGPVSPLQHYWSLAVEEQYYFVWPWLMLGILWLASTRASGKVGARRAVGVSLVVLTLASFAWSMLETAGNPSVAYFSTFSRAWELGVGALIAVFAGAFASIPTALRPVLAWVGLAGIVASVFVVSESIAFPAPWALAPVLSAALVIVAGTGGPQRFLWPLTNRVSVYLGDVSYSLYLWHFPIIIVMSTIVPDGGVITLLLTAALIVIWSLTSYHTLEDPIRRSRWLESPAKLREPGTPRPRRMRWIAASAVLLTPVLTVGLVGAALAADRVAGGASVAPDAATASSSDYAMGPEESKLAAEIRESLTAKTWPTLTPSLDAVLAGESTSQDFSRCARLDPPKSATCSWGPDDAPKTMIIVGDSTAAAYAPVFESIAAARGDWKGVSLALNGCRFSGVLFVNENVALDAACPQRIADALAMIASVGPDLVVITNNYGGTVAATNEKIRGDAWGDGTAEVVRQVVDHAGSVVLVSSPPAGEDVRKCFTALSTPSDCVSHVSNRWPTILEADATVARELGAISIDARRLSCAGSACPPFVAGVPMKRDTNHITLAYAQRIAPVMHEILEESGVFTG